MSTSRRPGRAARVRIIAREEYQRALESRWLFAFAGLFALFVLGLSYFGLAQRGEVGFASFARVTLSLLHLVLFIVPLVGLVLGVMNLTAQSETLALLLAQPVSRGEVLAGKFLGLGAALSMAQLLGLGGGGAIVALNAGPDRLLAFVVLCVVSLALGWLTLATALAIASLWPDRLKATGGALALWLVLVVGYDLGVIGVTTLLGGQPLRTVLIPALLLNPVDLSRVLVTLAVGEGALFGPTAAALMRTAGSSAGLVVGIAALAVQTTVPLLLALHVFRRRDW